MRHEHRPDSCRRPPESQYRLPHGGHHRCALSAGRGIANLWNTRLPYVTARAQASNGGIQNLNLLKAGDAQVSFAVSSITYEALHGQRGFKGRAYEGVRVLAGCTTTPTRWSRAATAA